MFDIVIVDYDCGNLFSIIRALERFKVNISVTQDTKVIINADRLILPGVGSFKEGMMNLKKRNLIEPIITFAKTGKPLLGICLGMQLLVDSSEEFGFHEGLGLISGATVQLRPINKAKIPHVGWNSLLIPEHQSLADWKNSLLREFVPGQDVYFVHSFVVVPKFKKDCITVTHYGQVEFASVIKKDNVTGCQFHPEKSGKNGIKMIKNFLFPTENNQNSENLKDLNHGEKELSRDKAQSRHSEKV